MSKMAWFAYNPIHHCYDRAESADAFLSTGTQTARTIDGQRDFEYGPPVRAPYYASDDEIEQMATCIYCKRESREVEPLPDVRDDSAWAEIAKSHAPYCQWVATRAHRVWQVSTIDNLAVIGSGQDKVSTHLCGSEGDVWDYLSDLTGTRMDSVAECEQYMIDHPGGVGIEIVDQGGMVIVDGCIDAEYRAEMAAA